MNRQQKEVFIDSFREQLTTSQGMFLVGYKGLNVAQVTALRKKLHADHGAFQVTKVTLLKRALENVEYMNAWVPHLKEQIGVVFSYDAPSSVAKTLSEFSKTNQKLSILAGSVDKVFLSAQDFSAFVMLPSKEVLLAQVCGTLQAPIAKFTLLLKLLMIRLVHVLKQIEEKKD